MNSSSPDNESHDELRELIDAVLDDRADANQMERLNQRLAESDEAVEFYVTYIDLHAELRWQRRGESANTVSVPNAVNFPKTEHGRNSGRRWLNARVFGVAAVLLVIAGFVVVPRFFRDKPTGPLTAYWSIETLGDAQVVVERDTVRLIAGEIHVRFKDGIAEEEARPIVIETPVGTATAKGTEFFIGTHKHPTTTEETTMRQLTRVLILTGTVMLANTDGTIEGGPNELLAAEKNAAPVRIAAESSGEFAFDLYRSLCDGRADENVFFSPYSLHVSLTMALEGARGTTAEEMAKALRFPPQARQIGDDAQSIPWRVALMHSGHNAIKKRFDRPETAAEKEIRAKVEKLKAELTKTNLSVHFLSALGQDNAAFRAQDRAEEIADDINEQMKKLDSLELNIANSLWGDKRYPFRAEFVETIAKHYDTGGIFPADFKNSYPEESGRIDAWVAEQTRGRIKGVMPRLNPRDAEALRLVLVNAIYFKGDWLTPFKPKRTRPRDFVFTDGSERKVPTMAAYGYEDAHYGAVNGDGTWFATAATRVLGVPIEQQEGLYPDANGYQILSMPYRGDDVSMVFVLPREGQSLDSLRKLITAERLTEWIRQMEQRKVSIRLPKFSLSTNYEMVEPLQSLGMKRAFVRAVLPEGADFSAICESNDPRLQLHLSRVIHKATVEVNESGTVAAAASAIMAKGEASERPQKRVPFTPSFYAERPFLVVIRDMKQGTILFLGHVNDPRG